MRDHIPIPIDEFKGFWSRGDAESCPIGYQTELINFKFIEGGIETRDGLDVVIATTTIMKMYYFPDASNQREGFIVLKSDTKLYHIYDNTGSGGWVTFQISNAIAGMTDFAFASKDGRAYLTPSANNNAGALPGEFLYVYDGLATTMMRKAGGTPITGALTAVNSGTAGTVEKGIHVFGVVAETNTGFQTEIGPVILPTVTADGTKKVDISTVAAGPSTTVKRHIVGSKAIDSTTYSGNPRDYELFFIPGATINNNTGGGTITVDFTDGSLVESAAHLLDLFSEIPAGGGLGFYHDRLLIWGLSDGTTDGNPTFVNEVLVSTPGEPESFDAVSGLLLPPREGIGITYCQEYRDVLYVAKFNRTYAFNDNGDDPVTWPSTVLDQGLGIAKRGVASIWTYGGINIESLIVINDEGIHLFSGTFNKPELSYVISDFWKTIDKNHLRNGRVHAYIDSTLQRLYVIIPQYYMILEGDFANGLTADKIRWSKWIFNADINTIMLFDKDNLLYIGANTGIHYVKPGKTDDLVSGFAAQKIPDPTCITALVNNIEPDDDNIYHYGGARIRVVGSGNIIPKLHNLDDTQIQTLATIVLALAPARYYFILANMLSQRARLELATTVKDEHIKINKINMYTKLTYTMYPA